MLKTEGLSWPSNYNDAEFLPWSDDPKELHIFDIPERFERGRAFWLQHYPPCNRDFRAVTTDLTPSYLRNTEAPYRMQEFYGGQSTQLKFGIILRNPLDRMLSEFHFFKNGLGRILCSPEEISVDFKTYVKNMMAGSDPCGLGTDSDYGAQLSNWFKMFSPSQFTIFLFKQVVAPENGRALIVSDLWEDLGFSEREPPAVQIFNVVPHQSLDDELDADTKADLQQFINTQYRDTLVDMLATAVEKPGLARFSDRFDPLEGHLWNPDAIRTWLETGW